MSIRYRSELEYRYSAADEILLLRDLILEISAPNLEGLRQYIGHEFMNSAIQHVLLSECCVDPLNLT